MKKTKLGFIAFAIGLGLVSGVALPADYPMRPITIVVPQAAGGASDVIIRIISRQMADQLGQPVVVDNRPGAGGNIGTVAVAKAKPDGYTLLFNINSSFLINPYLYKNAGFSPERDFVPVAPAATAGVVLVAAPTFPANNVDQLIKLANAKPGQITFASAGNGTLNHLLGEMFNRAARVRLQHIPYRGAAAAATDVMSGQVSVAFQGLASSIAQVQAGKLKVLAIANKERLEALPGTPTIGEILPGFGETPWYGLFAPAETPAPVIATLSAAVKSALADPVVLSSLQAQGAKPYFLEPRDFSALIDRELPRWKIVVQESGASID
ncbi:tripartite tricarboxylate transporter substrate binding protein [Xenophilus arseniciresistens]|uniref:Tripartite tricarboxylate transporter substrate binding protein n=1 Tax=Xenophilus arseniciresistens TaxID=1283306 RepID=A0AAE3NA35_9BURK|nr:tripartite tricarboxylate transporter substrate binding protein [Xenophilus arseniciresistens]MDA7417101.1 tripartite tricarboxylate transporter substrate binding protein [Xenophilus arseniciresistens]